jgi:hypothetical protein
LEVRGTSELKIGWFFPDEQLHMLKKAFPDLQTITIKISGSTIYNQFTLSLIQGIKDVKTVNIVIPETTVYVFERENYSTPKGGQTIRYGHSDTPKIGDKFGDFILVSTEPIRKKSGVMSAYK